MFGALLNTGTIVAGGLVGLLLGKGLPERVTDAIMKGLALVVIYIGITGLLEGENQLITILSVVLGGGMGAWLDFDGHFNRFGDWLSKKLARGDSRFSAAFVTTSLLFCVGAMAIIGSLQSGLSGDHSTLIAKSVIDGVSSVVFSATMGVGVVFSAAAILLVEGSITLLAQVIAPFLSTHAIAEITAMGSVLLLGMGCNMLGLTKLKILDYLPSIFVAAILAQFM
ncbi:MAG: DUF554 domain-containing protein [Clostridia bacterium]|nr:DUF554 domain-containing protein [Clostridia bacterium]